jgi:ribosomal protein L35
MPKMKTKSSAKKRFKLTGTGQIKRKHAFKSHILTKKSNRSEASFNPVHIGALFRCEINQGAVGSVTL